MRRRPSRYPSTPEEPPKMLPLDEVSKIISSGDTEKIIKELQKLSIYNEGLNRLQGLINVLRLENESINNISSIASILNSNPKIFSEAISTLTKEEIEALKQKTRIEVTPMNLSTKSAISSIYTSSPSTIPLSDLKTLLDSNISEYESTKKDYDEINLIVKELNIINPLEHIKFGDDHYLRLLFSSSSNFMIKLISGFMINSLKETIRPRTSTRKGLISLPKTIKASMKYGGTLYELKKSSKAEKVRPVKPYIYILIDNSGSQGYGIYISIALTYALINALKDYEIVVYAAGHHNTDSKTRQWIEHIEKHNINKALDPRTKIRRFTKQEFLKNTVNPSEMHTLLFESSDCDDPLAIFKSLVNVAPDNSLFLVFGDPDIFSNRSENSYINSLFSEKERHLLKSRFSKKLFIFNPSYEWLPPYSNHEYERYDSLRLTSFNFYPLNSKDFTLRNDATLYPITNIPVTYNDWVKEILKIVSSFSNKL